MQKIIKVTITELKGIAIAVTIYLAIGTLNIIKTFLQPLKNVKQKNG
jgi:hypothetical protein